MGSKRKSSKLDMFKYFYKSGFRFFLSTNLTWRWQHNREDPRHVGKPQQACSGSIVECVRLCACDEEKQKALADASASSGGTWKHS